MANQIDSENIFATIQRIIEGDTESFWTLVSPYQRSLYLTAYSLLHNPDDAKDVVQETMLKALNNLARLKDAECLKAWLHKIAINEARLKMHRSRGEISYDIDCDKDFRPRDYVEWKDIPSNEIERKELREAIERALQCLSPALCEVFTLRDLQEFTVPEVSQILGLKEAQVSLRLHRARLRMREFLAPLLHTHASPWMPLQMMPDMPAMLIHRVISCKKVIRELSNYIEKELDAALRDEIEKHLKYCRRCRILLHTQKKLLYLVADKDILLPPFSFEHSKLADASR